MKNIQYPAKKNYAPDIDSKEFKIIQDQEKYRIQLADKQYVI